MTTLSDLQTRLEALKLARASGVRVIDYAGRRTEYKSDSEMAAAVASIEQEIGKLDGTNVVRAFYPVSRKCL